MSLPQAYAGVAFAQPARARANLELLKGRLPERLLSLLPTVLGQVPDPDIALNNLERFTREAGGRVTDALLRQPALLHYLLALFSHSRFLGETLIQQPDLIVWLGRDKNLARLKSKEDLLEEYARFETAALEAEPALALARFKRREYLRITLRDILGMAELGETTLELSTLADVLLEKALAMARRELEKRYGAPQTTDARGRPLPARFAIVSLGKLGGRELNYSSDVDLLFLYAGEGETSAPAGRIATSEFFIRLAQRLLQIIAGVTPQGAVFRVDMRLRPGGGEGDLALSLPAAVDYYQRRAREWELQMLLKARHSAGDPGLVRDFLVGVEPCLFRGEMHFAAVESVLQAREGFDRKLDARLGGRLDVKLAPGGIRDIEFFVQCLQRLYGREDPWVRAPGTLLGLQRLYDKGHLSARDHFHLAAAYQFLRTVEHRLQLEQGHQTHSLPENREALALLARRCGLAASPDQSAAEAFRQQLEEHLRHVRAIYEHTLPHTLRAPDAEEFSLRSPETVGIARELSYEKLLRLLRSQGSPLYQVLEGLEIPERARKPVHRFLTAALASSASYEQANRAAAALPLAVEILRLSEPLGAMLVRQPEQLAELLALGQGKPGAAAGQRRIPLDAALPGGFDLRAQRRGPLARRMADLRRGFREMLFRWGARELCGGRPAEAGMRDYTALAEGVLRAALAIAAEQAEESGSAEATGLAVLALGRLGTGEMDLGSDADLVFVAADARAQARARPVAEKLLHVVSGYTREGTLFPVDVRLRPRGSEGELVQTAEAVLDYFATTAEAWEAVTYLKARPVVGDLGLGEGVCEKVRAVLAARFTQMGPVRTALKEMRQRLEAGGARSEGSADNFKTGLGGVYDLDFLVSAAALAAGARSLAGRSLAEQVADWSAAAAVSDEERRQLTEAARLLRVLDHSIRLVSGRATPQLPTGPRADLVAELAGRWLEESVTAATLAVRLADVRASVREIFDRLLG